MKRRDFIKYAGASMIVLNSPLVFANQSNFNLARQKPLIWIMLRGGLDSLHTIFPLADPDFLKYRRVLIDPIRSSLLTLNNSFSLHPRLKLMHELFHKGEMIPVVAVASGYRERSHFQAQDEMESGLDHTDHNNGWLARALNQYTGQGLAIARTIPIALSGKTTAVQTWFPSDFDSPNIDTMERLNEMYREDKEMTSWLEQAYRQQIATGDMNNNRRASFLPLARACAGLIANQETINCAMIETDGWDTHNKQAPRLNRLFMQFNQGIDNIRRTLRDKWDDTLIVVTTEFGRTVALNGTRGSDHGIATSMFFTGGSIRNNKSAFENVRMPCQQVLGKWPGLDNNNLYEGRDLKPTSDVRYWIGNALKAHWGLSTRQIKQIFPDIEY